MGKIKSLNETFKPYKAQFDRCRIRIKIIAILCVMYLSVPIGPFDILFPWVAFADDLFIAGILLKILHKYGGLEEEVLTSPIELLRDVFNRTKKKWYNRTMITIILIALTWYLTKVYYTKTLKVSIYDLEQHNLMQATCSKCAQTLVIHMDDMRNPFYCLGCKTLR